MMKEYIAMQDDNGKVHVNTVDTSGEIALAYNVRQYKTLVHIAKVFPDNTGINFVDEREEPQLSIWDKEAHYNANDIVIHKGKTWVALSDVECGSQPDDIYDMEADPPKGGWVPFNYSFSEK